MRSSCSSGSTMRLLACAPRIGPSSRAKAHRTWTSSSVCDNAAGEVCPVWPGRPASAHWGFPDPAAFEGTEAETAAVFAEVYGQIERLLSNFVKLPIEALDGLSLKQRLEELAASESQNA